MTLTTTTARHTYIGTGATGPFPYTFRIYAASDMQVWLRSPTGVEYQLASSAYTITNVGKVGGGSVTVTAGVPVGHTILLLRRRPVSQLADFRNQGAFYPETHEDAFDHGIMVAQQLQEQLDRTIRLPRTTTDAVDLTIVPRAGQVVAWTTNGLGLESRPLSSSNILLPGNGRTTTSISEYLDENKRANVRDFGAVGDGVADDTLAFQLAMAASLTIYLPAGTYKVANLDVQYRTIVGEGRDSSKIVGVGDLLVNAQFFHMRHCSIENTLGAVQGKLVSILGAGVAVNASSFDDIGFKRGTHHVYSDRLVVDWHFTRCTFNEATVCSREFFSAWAFYEADCYTWYNARGIRIYGGHTIRSIGCVYEYQTLEAVHIRASDGSREMNAVTFVSAHFEGNGVTTPTEAVRIESINNSRVRNVTFLGCTFIFPSGVAAYVKGVMATGGNILRVKFMDCWVAGTLTTPGQFSDAPTYFGNEFNSGAPATDALIVENLLLRSEPLGVAVVGSGVFANEVVAVPGRGLVYTLTKQNGAAEGTSLTTFNITGVTAVEGAFFFIVATAAKLATVASVQSQVAVQVNGTTVIPQFAFISATAGSATKTATVAFANGAWRVVGSVSP